MSEGRDRWHRWLTDTAYLKPLVESGAGRERLAVSYLAAAKG